MVFMQSDIEEVLPVVFCVIGFILLLAFGVYIFDFLVTVVYWTFVKIGLMFDRWVHLIR